MLNRITTIEPNYKRNLNRNIIIREMEFLKENFPDSHMCGEDFSDIDLVIEK